MGFLREFRQRRLFQILAAYAAAGWVALEVAAQLTQQGVLPDLAYDLTLIWYVCGLPAAAVVGWFHGEKGAQKAPKAEVALLVLLALLGIGASGTVVSDDIAQRLRRNAALEGLNLHRIGVLYFDDLTGGDGARHLADGFTEALIDELATVRELDVVSRNGVAAYRGADVSPDSIGRALGAGTLVGGSIERAGDQLRVDVRVLDGQSGQVFARTSFTRPAEQLVDLRDEMVEQSAALLREWLGEEVRLRRTKRRAESVPAWALYQRGERVRKDGEQAAQHGDAHAMAAAFARADSLLAQAELLDPAWADPPVLRGWIAYRRARIAGGAGHVHESAEWVERGLPHVERALALEPNNARALEVRGTLKYLYRLLEVIPDRARLTALLDEAQRDLERAVELDPALASAHATLSHLYLRRDPAAVVIAARRAYEEDAYLENAEVVVDRIITGAYNLEQFVEARRWCDIGRRRFPDDHRFVRCDLMLMTTAGAQPDVPRAWALLARLDSLAPEHQAGIERIQGELFVGGALARAGQPDSARAVWRRARAKVTPHIDPARFMNVVEAYMRVLAGDHDEAIDLLRLYVAVNPGAAFDDHWQLRDLRSHPRWAQLHPAH